MRRVIGNLYRAKKENDEIWFLGIVGKELAKQPAFNGWGERVIYVAKVSGVEEYHEYFDGKQNRKDKIYLKTKPNKDIKLTSGEYYFEHNGGEVHNSLKLQCRDFDVDHPKSKKYVLESYEYCFISKSDSEEIKKAIKDKYQKWPTGVGHRWFKEENNKLGKLLSGLVKNGKNESILSAGIKEILSSEKGCGKKKGGNH